MVFRRRTSPRKVVRRKKRTQRVRGRTNSTSSGSNVIGYLRLFRMALTTLPLDSSIKTIFDIVFNLIYSVISSASYNTGAYAMFGISPAALFLNSPYLAAVDSTTYSFPGHPISMKWLRLNFRNTTKASEFSGRWAVVLIPYREEHDGNQYAKILADLKFSEIVAMPYAKSATADKDITINYRMRDRTAYCARPREINEEIAVAFIIWDSSCRDDLTVKVTNSTFNCEVELHGGCVPHEIFGPKHRVKYSEDTFKIRSVTDGNKVRLHLEDGSVLHMDSDEFERQEHSFEMINE